jgi:phosphoribosylanthranilate isomerase
VPQELRRKSPVFSLSSGQTDAVTGHLRAEELAPNGLFVKICGVTNEEDALLCVAMGADALGFNFVSGSKRQVAPTVVADIVKRLPTEVITFGIFRDDLPDRVVDLTLRCGLTGAQLHGRESAEVTADVAGRVGVTIKVFAAGDPVIGRAKNFPVELIMIDNPTPGSGEVFDWSLADGLPEGRKLILAGGLGPVNVADAIRRVRPWGVDVASGTEASAGRKDARKVASFIRNARRAAESIPGYEFQDTAPYDWQSE